MAEIILPPEENEETPQVPELNIDKPSGNSKVITIEFEAKKTNKVSTKDTNQQLYTTDTDAWFEFKETSLEGANGTYSVVFRNRHDGSIFQRTGDVVNGVAYYKIPHQEIRHAGAWRGQIVYTLSNGDTTAREFGYDVKGHILDGKDVREIVVEDFETLMSQLNSMKDNAELELADLVNAAERNELERQQFYESLVDDIEQLQSNYQELLDTGVLQTNINNKLEQLEEEYAPKLMEVTAQLAQTNTVQAESVINKPASKQLSIIKKRQPLVLFTDDDGSSQIVPKLKPVSEETGVPFSIALIEKRLRDGTSITLKEAKDLQDELGWEVLSHGYDDTALGNEDLTEDELERQIRDSMKYLREKGFNVQNFVYPGGQASKSAIRVVSKYANAALGTGVAPNNYPLQMYNINRLPYPQSAPNNTLSYYKSKVDEAVANNQILVWMLHCGQPELDENQLSILVDLINYIKSIGVKMPTVQGAVDLVGNVIDINNREFYMTADGTNNIFNTVFKNSLPSDSSDLVNVNDSPSSFERNKMTISIINSDRNLVPSGLRGVLITYALTNTSYFSQMIIDSRGDIFTRHSINANSWSDFKKSVSVKQSLIVDLPQRNVKAGTSFWKVVDDNSIRTSDIMVAQPVGTLEMGLSFNCWSHGQGQAVIEIHNGTNADINMSARRFNIRRLEI